MSAPEREPLPMIPVAVGLGLALWAIIIAAAVALL